MKDKSAENVKRALFSASILVAVALFFAARNAASWRPQLLFGQREKDPQFQFSRDGHWLLIQGDENVLWDWQNRRLARKVPFGFYRFSPDGKLLARLELGEKKSGKEYSFATTVEISQTASGRTAAKFADPKRQIYDSLQDAQWSADGKNLVVATVYSCRIFDAQSGKIVARWDAGKHKSAAVQSALSNDGAQLLRLRAPTSESPYPNSELRRADNGQFLQGFHITANVTEKIGFAPDQKRVYSVPNSGNLVHFWDAKTAKLVATAKTDANFGAPHFLKNPNLLAFASPSGIEIRQIPGSQVVEKLGGPPKEPFAFAPDENSAVSCDAKGQIFRWRVR